MRTRRHRAIMWAEQGCKRKKYIKKNIHKGPELLKPITIKNLSDFSENAAKRFSDTIDAVLKTFSTFKDRRLNK